MGQWGREVMRGTNRLRVFGSRSASEKYTAKDFRALVTPTLHTEGKNGA